MHLNEFTYTLENYTYNLGEDDDINTNAYDDVLENLQADLQEYRQEDQNKAK